ncbi:MAG: hypothetical protein ACYSOH_03965 [Planctomycetota bacterium]
MKIPRCRLTMKIKKTASMSPAGFILLVTMIVLVVLTTLAAGLSVHLSLAKRRQQYRIEYQRSRYGADSAMKYILSVLPTRNFTLLESRLEQPDFSDLFWMNEIEYAEFIAAWAETATDEQIEGVLKEGASLTTPVPLSDAEMASRLTLLFGGGSDANEMGMDAYNTAEQLYLVELDPNDVVVPGPYGVPWPNAAEPIHLEMGPCKVTITIEDENAKMPLSWLVTSSEDANKRSENALKTFCEWMSWNPDQLREMETHVRDAMDKIAEKKTFKLNPSPILLKTATKRTVSTRARTSRVRQASQRRRTATTSRTISRVTTKERPVIAHTTDFAKLFHSSLLNREILARPLPDTGERMESPLKYLSLWGAQRININTAPRNVLEAAFSLAIDAFDLPEFTQEVIEKRKEKPLVSIDELAELGGLDTETMDNLKNYLTTTSTFFQLQVTSQSGNARSSAVATVVKEGKNVQQLMILYEQ